jgi:Xaa-Pro aminopeptidase
MDANTYRDRRQVLREAVPDGAILLVANHEAPRNYVDNPYPFRQDSHFLYYVGVGRPQLAALLEPDGSEVLYGPDPDPDELVWFGPQPQLEDLSRDAGFERHDRWHGLVERLRALNASGTAVHYLPPYRWQRRFLLGELLGADPREVDGGHSEDLVRAVAAQRSIKSTAEVAEIEQAITVTSEMYRAAMAATRPGFTEAQIAAKTLEVVLSRGRQLAFPPIVTIRGEVLHNASYGNTLSAGDLLVMDSGAESERQYASDITRTWPVSGRFSPEQRAVYEVVLAAQQAALDLASPAATNRQVHLGAARVIAEGLLSMGLMQGDVDDAVTEGAHALFFPHGIGHMLGLDVHDMEDLGDIVGYPEGEARSEQFGLSLLRMVRQLEPGFVATIEPGVYFIPALIDRWRSEERHRDFIRYDRLEPFRTFGGVRIEDDVLITDDGCRVLGPGIPKTIDEVEAAVGWE